MSRRRVCAKAVKSDSVARDADYCCFTYVKRTVRRWTFSVDTTRPLSCVVLCSVRLKIASCGSIVPISSVTRSTFSDPVIRTPASDAPGER